MILQGCVKQFKCKTIKKNVISIWGGGGFHIVFGDRVTKWPIAKENHQNICALGCTTIS
jgi:hypothetical protein